MGQIGSAPLALVIDHLLFGPVHKIRKLTIAPDGRSAIGEGVQTVFTWPSKQTRKPVGLIRTKSISVRPMSLGANNHYHTDTIRAGEEYYLVNSSGHFLTEDRRTALRPLYDSAQQLVRNSDGSIRGTLVKVTDEAAMRAIGHEKATAPLRVRLKAFFAQPAIVIYPRLILVFLFSALFDTSIYELGKYVGRHQKSSPEDSQNPLAAKAAQKIDHRFALSNFSPIPLAIPQVTTVLKNLQSTHSSGQPQSGAQSPQQ